MRVITEFELQSLKDTLEDSFTMAKGEDDIALMIDLSRCMELVTKLSRKTAEELIGNTGELRSESF